MTPAEETSLKIVELDAALKSEHPTMPGLLREIFIKCKEDPDIITILSDEERNVIIEGCKKQAQVVITTAAVKGNKKKSPKSIAIGTDL